MLVAAPADVLLGALVGVEAGDVGGVRVAQARVAVGDPLRDQARGAGPLLDPYRRRRPQPLHLGGLAEHLVGVRRQRQQPVHRVLHLGTGEQLAHDLARVAELGREVVAGERHLGGRPLRLREGGNIVRTQQDRAMGIRTHLHRLVALALVHEHVHVAHDRVADFVAGPAHQVDRAQVRHLVHRRGKRNIGAGHGGDARAPHAAGDHHLRCLDGAAVGRHGANARTPERAALHLQPGHLGVVQHGQHALGQRAFAHDGAGLDRVHHRHGRRVEAALDHVAVDERHPGHHLVRGEQLGLDPPGARRGHAPAQLLHALLGARHLDPAAGSVHPQRLVLALALQRKHRDLAVVIGGEDEVGGVAGGAAGIGQRPLVDQHQLVPPQLRKVPHQAVADNAGADHHDPGAPRHYTRT